MFWPAEADYEFGPFRIDANERELLRNGEVVPLTPKVFDVLLALVGSHSTGGFADLSEMGFIRVGAPARRNKNSSTQLSGGSCSNSITDESLPKLPYGARRAVCGGDDRVE